MRLHLLVLVSVFALGASLKAKWTPNPDDDEEGGPLPLSFDYREKLAKLCGTCSPSLPDDVPRTDLHNRIESHGPTLLQLYMTPASFRRRATLRP